MPGQRDQRPPSSLSEDSLDRILHEAFLGASPPSESVLEVIERRTGSLTRVALRDAVEAGQAPARGIVAEDGGRYELLEEISGDESSTVWRSRDRDLGRDVALKILRHASVEHEAAFERLLEEAQVGAQLEHPGIVPVYGIGLAGGDRPYFAMKLVRSDTLAAFLARREDIAAERPGLLRIFERVCRAVSYAHGRGVAHRDLTPASIVVGPYEDTLVVDWGKATFQRTEADLRDDVRALGAILGEILTGDPSGARLEDSNADPALLSLCRRCLSSRGGEQPPRPGDISDAITQHQAALETRAREAELAAAERGEEAKVARARRQMETRRAESARRARRLTALIAAIVVAAAAVGIGGFVLWRSEERSSAARCARVTIEALQTASRHEGAGDLEAAVEWAERAVARAQGGQADAEVLDRALEVLARIEEQKRAAEDAARTAALDEALLARLEEIRVHHALSTFGTRAGSVALGGIQARLLVPASGAGLGPREVDAAFAEAFRDHGLDLDRMTSAEAAEAVRSRSTPSRLAAALETWAGLRRSDPTEAGLDWKGLLEIARAADPDPWRDALRDAARREDPEAIRELAETASVGGLPSPTVCLLTARLLKLGQRDRALALLRVAQCREPGDFWINHGLACALLAGSDAAELEEGIGYALAALSLHPKLAWNTLGMGLQRLGDLQGAAAAFKKQVDCLPAGAPGTAVPLGNLGLVREDENDLDKAEEAHRKALALAPSSAAAHDRLGTVLLKREKVEEALVAARTAIELDPEFAEAHNNLGVVLLTSGDVEGAVLAFREAIALKPEEAIIHFNLGTAYRDQRKAELAANAYREAIERDPGFALAHSELGVALHAGGDFNGASRSFRRAIKADQDCAEAHHNLGMVLLEQRDFRAAAISFRRVLELWPDYASAHYGLGTALLELQDPDGALTELRKAVKLQPDDAALYDNLGVALLRRGDHQGAVRAFRTATQLRPGFAPLHFRLGRALRAAGDPAGAAAAFRKAADLVPDNHEYLHRLARAHIAAESYEEAIAALRRLIEVKPDDARALNKLAFLLAYCPVPIHRDPNEAIVLARRATQLTPKARPPWNTLGLAHLQAGEFEKAIQALERSMELSGGGTAHDWLPMGIAHARLGNHNQARAWLSKGLRWLKESKSKDEELFRLRDETRALLEDAEGR